MDASLLSRSPSAAEIDRPLPHRPLKPASCAILADTSTLHIQNLYLTAHCELLCRIQPPWNPTTYVIVWFWILSVRWYKLVTLMRGIPYMFVGGKNFSSRRLLV